MTVGELIKKLVAYDDDVEVLLQEPGGRTVWPVFPCLGEDEGGEHVYVIATEPARARWAIGQGGDS